jgi:hypothetical protein
LAPPDVDREDEFENDVEDEVGENNQPPKYQQYQRQYLAQRLATATAAAAAAGPVVKVPLSRASTYMKFNELTDEMIEDHMGGFGAGR